MSQRGMISRMRLIYCCIGFVSIVGVVVIYLLANSVLKFRADRLMIDGSSVDIVPSAAAWSWTSSLAAPDTVNSSKCEPRTNIFFLKTHKCASSTVQNVLLRFGHKRGLTFVLPTLGNYLGNQSPFHRAMAAVAPWHVLGYNIFCHHTVFQVTEVAAVMPRNTEYISIIREPVSLFESLYSFAHLELHYRQTLEEFAATRSAVHQSHLSASAAFKTNADRALGYLGVNQMAYDFGISPRDFNNLTLVKERVRLLDKKFRLVMVAEYFDESMILLKEYMCWSLEDVAYFRHNARRDAKKRHLSAETGRQLETLNEVDVYIYRYFKRKFLAKVKKYGNRKMKNDVTKLRELNSKLDEYCSDNGSRNGFHANNGSQGVAAFRATGFPPFVAAVRAKTVFRAFSEDVVDLPVRSGRRWNRTCTDMSISELDFTDKLKAKQLAMAVQVLKKPEIKIRLTRGFVGTQLTPLG